MNAAASWWAALLTAAIPALYELLLWWTQWARPGQVARTAHAQLRESWFHAVSALPGTEILAVQTLRNSLMSATMIASTAAIGLVGVATLVAPSLQAVLATQGLFPHATARLAMELLLMTVLFASLVFSVMAVRYYNHAGFIGGMPVGSPQRQRWAATGTAYVRKAGLLYSWGLRQLMLLVPVVAFLLHPLAGVVGALLVVAALLHFDRFSAGE